MKRSVFDDDIDPHERYDEEGDLGLEGEDEYEDDEEEFAAFDDDEAPPAGHLSLPVAAFLAGQILREVFEEHFVLDFDLDALLPRGRRVVGLVARARPRVRVTIDAHLRRPLFRTIDLDRDHPGAVFAVAADLYELAADEGLLQGQDLEDLVFDAVHFTASGGDPDVLGEFTFTLR
jgi:hypothetical protein